jgi:serine/threonine-protein kinase
VSASLIICPGCRAAFDADTNYCARCGTSLRATPAEERERKTEPAMMTVLAPDEPDPLIGETVDGRYRVLERIGSGGMGIVYKVEHLRMGKIAAMKVLHRDLVAHADVVKRFRREAEAVSRLANPHTVQTFDFGTAGGALYLVMEYVRGEDLGTILRRDGPMPWARAAPIFVQICEALAEAHELGIVHRDLKPENIVVVHGKDGRDHAKVLDFGLAKISAREEPAADSTGQGMIIGTPFYMAPEQIRGEELDGRADVYALGAVLYRVLTGEPPFAAQSPVGVLTKALTDELVAPRRRKPELGLPETVDRVVTRAMARSRDERYPTVDALKADLERAAPGAEPAPRVGAAGAVAGARVGAATQGHRRLQREDFDSYERSLRRRTWVRGILLPIGFLGLAGSGVAAWRWQRAQPQSVEHEPNDDLASATPIGAERPVRGKIGVRIGPEQGDRDYFKLPTGARPGAPLRLRVELECIPNADLLVAVFDQSGKQLAVADAEGIGQREILPNLGITSDPIYLEVVESREGTAHPPTENLSDEYMLTAGLAAPAAGEELEPNDSAAQANPLAAGQPLHGTLARAGDVDMFRFTGAEGRYDIALTGAPAAQVALRADETALRGRRGRATLRPGSLITVERVDGPVAEGPRAVVHGTSDPYELVVTPAALPE